LGMLCQHQIDQFFTAQLSHILLRHRGPILPSLAIFAKV
jgi:hypothetical protein